MKLLLQFTFFFAFLGFSAQSQTIFDEINSFLIENVDAGKVEYKKLKKYPSNLNKIIQLIETTDLSNQSSDYKLAFYINAYNLIVIKQVLDNYPISSPMDVKGFFKEKKFTVAGEKMTLDQLEFEKLFGPYKDPRIHFALGCAALSCPFLYDNAYTPDHIQEQLKFRSQLIIDTSRYVKIDNKAKTVTLNKIFDWYKDQFTFSAGSLIKFINKYRYYKVAEDYKIVFEEYNWKLNDM